MRTRRFSITRKITVFVILVVLASSFAIALLSYFFTANQIDTFYKRLSYNSAENFSAALDVSFIRELKEMAESEEFQSLRETAEQTENEQLVEDFLIKKGMWEKYASEREKMCTYLDIMDDIKYLYIMVLGNQDALFDMYLLDDYDNPLYQTGNYEPREPELIGIDTSKTIEPTITDGSWGWLCSSYAPVYDADGNLICHVGCDIDMASVMAERNGYLISAALITLGVMALLLAAAMIFTGRVFVRPLRRLTEETKKFRPAKDLSYEEAGVVKMELRSHDEISDMYQVIRRTQMHMIDYLNDLHKLEQDNRQYVQRLDKARNDIRDKEEQIGRMSREVYRDALTHVGSKTAYIEKTEELSGEIANGTAQFAVVMVDLNDLKRINDEFGHKCGDLYIQGCCHMICEIFDHSPVFRIGGDEFVVVLDGEDYVNREALTLRAREAFIRSYADRKKPAYQRYSAAVGLSELSPEDNAFEFVFRRADKEMYVDKMSFKVKNGSYR